MKNIFLEILFLPKRYYYALLSPEEQFTKLIQVIKNKPPSFYVEFEALLQRRFLMIKHPRSIHEFVIDVGEGKEIYAYFEVDDTDDGLRSVLLRKTGEKKPLKIHRFKDAYYGPGMH